MSVNGANAVNLPVQQMPAGEFNLGLLANPPLSMQEVQQKIEAAASLIARVGDLKLALISHSQALVRIEETLVALKDTKGCTTACKTYQDALHEYLVIQERDEVIRREFNTATARLKRMGILDENSNFDLAAIIIGPSSSANQQSGPFGRI